MNVGIRLKSPLLINLSIITSKPDLTFCCFSINSLIAKLVSNTLLKPIQRLSRLP